MDILYLHDEPLEAAKANVIQVLHMCEALSELKQRVTLAVPQRSGKKGFLSSSIQDIAAEKMGKTPHFHITTYPRFTLKGRFTMVGGYLGARRLLKNMKSFPSCIYLRNPVLLNLPLKNELPTLFESHGSFIHNRSRLLDRLWRKNLVKNARSSHLIQFITISRRLAETWISRGIPEEKTTVLPDGFDASLFSNPPTQKEAREKLSLPPDKKIVVYTGSLYPNRGIEKVLDLASAFPETLFLVLGGPEEREIHYQKDSQNRGLSNLRFEGYLPHPRVASYLFAADVLLMVFTPQVKTIHDCSPLKMFEYMAAGRIIVGQAFPSIQEVLTHSQNALLADPYSFDDLKHNLERALQMDYPNQLSREARKLVFGQYSWKKRAQKILDLIHHI